MAFKAFYGEVKKVIPEWLKEELYKLRGSVKRDFDLIKKELELFKDVALIDYDSLKGVLENLNNILQSCTTNNNERVVFAIVMPDENNVFWKTMVEILCLRINLIQKTVRVAQRMTIYQFWKLRSNLLAEIHYKNFLEGKPNDSFQLVNNDGEVEGEENAFEEPLSLPTSLTVSTVLQRVNEASHNSKEDECLICMDNKIEVSLSCAHSFCLKCIKQWHHSNRTCPICRMNLKNEDEYWEFADLPDLDEVNKNVVKLAEGT